MALTSLIWRITGRAANRRLSGINGGVRDRPPLLTRGIRTSTFEDLCCGKDSQEHWQPAARNGFLLDTEGPQPILANRTGRRMIRNRTILPHPWPLLSPDRAVNSLPSTSP